MDKRLLILIIMLGIFVISCAQKIAKAEYIPFSRTIAMDSNQNIHLVWSKLSTHQGGVYYKVWRNGTWSENVLISNETGGGKNPSIFIDSKNNVLIVWRGDLYYKIFNGSSWTNTYKINNLSTDYTNYYSAYLDKKDNLHIAWDEEEKVPVEGHYSTYRITGKSLNYVQIKNNNITRRISFKFDKNNRIDWIDLLAEDDGRPHIFISGNLGEYGWPLDDVIHYSVTSEGYTQDEMYNAYDGTYQANGVTYVDYRGNIHRILDGGGDIITGHQINTTYNSPISSFISPYTSMVYDSINNSYIVSKDNWNNYFEISAPFTNLNVRVKETDTNWSNRISIECINASILPLLVINESNQLFNLCVEKDGIIRYNPLNYTFKERIRFGGTKLIDFSKYRNVAPKRERIKDISEYNQSEINIHLKSALKDWLIRYHSLSYGYLDKHIIVKNISIISKQDVKIAFIHKFNDYEKEYRVIFPITKERKFAEEWYYRNMSIATDQEDVFELLSVNEVADNINITNKRPKIEECTPDACKPLKPEEIVPKEFSCEIDEDCKIVLTGCRVCGRCGRISIEDPDVIAVNRYFYDPKCPPRPKDIVCIACVGWLEFDPDKQVACINKKCEKLI